MVSVAPQVLGSTPRGSEFLAFVLSVVGDVLVNSETPVVTLSIEDLLAQSSKMFLGSGFTCVYS
jgi:hypothetical protein